MRTLHFPAAYAAYVDAELTRIVNEVNQDAYERANGVELPRLVPDREYDASATGSVILNSFQPNDPLHLSVRSLIDSVRSSRPAQDTNTSTQEGADRHRRVS